MPSTSRARGRTGVGQPGEPRHLDAVRAVRAARLQPVQEQHLSPTSRTADVVVPDVLQLVGQLRQLVVVRREHRLAADARRAGARSPPTRSTTPSYVDVPRPISSSSTRLRAVARVQDRARLAHLHHERRLPAHQVVARADAREDAGRPRRSRAARAGTKLPICAISTISPICRRIVDLPAMFGPVRMITALGLGEPHVVRDELVARHHPLDHRMPARRDLEIEVVGASSGARSPRAPRPRRAPPARRARATHARGALQPRDRRARRVARSASNSSRSRASIRSAALSTLSSYSLSAGVT